MMGDFGWRLALFNIEREIGEQRLMCRLDCAQRIDIEGRMKSIGDREAGRWALRGIKRKPSEWGGKPVLRWTWPR